MSNTNSWENLVDHARDYVESKTELTKLQLVEKGSRISGELMLRISVLMVTAVVVLMFSVAGALAIGEWYGKYSIGFLAIGIVYIISGLLLYLFRDVLIKRPVENGIIRSILNDKDHD